MGKPNKYNSGKPTGQPTTIPEKQKTNEEKKLSRFVFACVGMLLYTMPGVSLAALGMAMGAAQMWMIIGIILMFLGAALGFMGVMLLAKQRGKILVGVLSTVLACLTVVPMPFIGGWCFVFLPVFVLLVLCIANIGAFDKKPDNM